MLLSIVPPQCRYLPPFPTTIATLIDKYTTPDLLHHLKEIQFPISSLDVTSSSQMQHLYDVARKYYEPLVWQDDGGMDTQAMNMYDIINVRLFEIRHNMFDTLFLKLKTKHSS